MNPSLLLLLLRLLLLWVVPGYTRSFSFENNNNNNNNNNNARGSVARMRSTFLKKNTRINRWNSSGSRSSSNGSGLYSTPTSLAEQIVQYLAEEKSNNHCSGDDDATSFPSKLFGFFSASSSLEDDNGNSNNKKHNNINNVVTYSSDTIGGGSTGNDYPVLVLSLEDYSSMISDRHSDCQVLFDRYETKTLRCERIIPETTTTTTQQQQQQQLVYNIRWEASWIPMGSVWLYDLSDKCEWKINRRVPDPSQIATFAGWTRVYNLFQQAFQTGIIDLPISVVQGTTLLKLQGLSTDDDDNDMENTNNSNHINGNKNDETTRSSAVATKISCKRIVVRESIDLIREANLGRLQNRRVAQELASWLDVSRRPPKNNAAAEDEEERWASIVRERVLSGVPGTGPLDVDPNENENEGLVAFVVFGAICLVALTSSYAILILDVFGRHSSFSELCSSDGGAVTKSFDVGSGYFSDCY